MLRWNLDDDPNAGWVFEGQPCAVAMGPKGLYPVAHGAPRVALDPEDFQTVTLTIEGVAKPFPLRTLAECVQTALAQPVSGAAK